MNPTLNTNQPPVLLVRHGLATLSLNGYGDDMLTAELLPKGKEAVENAAAFAAAQNPTQLWASPLRRCQQTAEILAAKTGLKVVTDPLLTEYSEEMEETFAHFVSRMKEVVEKIRQQSPEKMLCICTHGAVIAALSHLLTNRAFSRLDLNDYPTPAGVRIIEQDKLTQKMFQSY
jgi:broad specificity phosphatase PhoE